ncbi:hypothetical protein [Oscillatoria nigro-viridis]|uniref:hypothetical protein n=1 Tax=Phormidium nigroviride TaxID=482564 RepID=UPI0002D9306F|nr:hypothetical protein [Oscillatoria nigro-viridis]
MLSENKENIRDGKSVGHDHYFKKNGKWYVQIKASQDNPFAVDKKGHLFDRSGNPGEKNIEKNLEFQEVADYNMGEHLDRMWERLTGELRKEELWPPID